MGNKFAGELDMWAESKNSYINQNDNEMIRKIYWGRSRIGFAVCFIAASDEKGLNITDSLSKELRNRLEVSVGLPNFIELSMENNNREYLHQFIQEMKTIAPEINSIASELENKVNFDFDDPDFRPQKIQLNRPDDFPVVRTSLTHSWGGGGNKMALLLIDFETEKMPSDEMPRGSTGLKIKNYK